MDQLTITFVTATTALIASVAGPLMSYRVAREQIRAKVISTNRERWVETLRDSIAEYAALATAVGVLEQNAPDDMVAAVLEQDELRAKAERLLLMRGQIYLMTNPNKPAHHELRTCLEHAHQALLTNGKLDLSVSQSNIQKIMDSGHAVLRYEWERIKRIG